jgi:radical SAM superfamily enzyme YgiQ (UPF0313 family)
MDILLTHGYILSEDPHEAEIMRPYPPLGLLYLSSYLKERGYEVGVSDATFGDPASFHSLVEAERPPVVGIYANMLTRGTALRMARFCRDRGSRVVMGGPDPANYPRAYLTRGADVVVVGEGERTLEELLVRSIGGMQWGVDSLRGVKGIVYREEGGQIVRTEPRLHIDDLDALPFPDRTSIDVDAYLRAWRRHHGRGSVSLITARGCPYRCAWCSHAVFGYSHRQRSPENVAAEVELILDAYAPEMLWYADDVFGMDKEWLRSYAEELERRQVRVPFEATSREDRLDEDVVRTLADMGCFRLWIGAESGSQRLLDRMNRRIDAARVPEVSRLLRRHGIEVGMFVMLGYEGEAMADLQATAKMLAAAKPDQFLTVVAYPIKGTPYFEAVRERIAAPTPWEEGSDRDLVVTGRRSKRYYDFATRWLVNRVAWRRRVGDRNWLSPRTARAFLNAQVGRLGMWFTQGEVVRGG